MGADRETPRPFPGCPTPRRCGASAPTARTPRFGSSSSDFSDRFAGTGFQVFAEALAQGGDRGLIGAERRRGARRAASSTSSSRSAPSFGAKGLAWIRINADGWQSPLAKFLGDAEREASPRRTGSRRGPARSCRSEPRRRVRGDRSAQLRLRLGAAARPDRRGRWDFLWVDRLPAVRVATEDEALGRRSIIPSRRRATRTSTGSRATRRGPRSGVRHGAQRHRARRRLIRIHRPDVQERVFGAARHRRERSARAVRLPARGPGLRRAAARRHRARARPALVMLLAGATRSATSSRFPKTQRASVR